MKKLLFAAVALAVVGGSAATAQPYDRHGDYGRDRGDYGRDRGDYGRDRGDYGRRHDGPGPGGWSRGGYMPREYWSRQYEVRDWRVRHLRPPPRGYHWVRHGNDYVLAALTTGLIADIIAGSR